MNNRTAFVIGFLLLLPAAAFGQKPIVDKILGAAGEVPAPQANPGASELPEPTFQDPFLPKVPLVWIEDRTETNLTTPEPLPDELPPEELVPVPAFDIVGMVWNSRRPQAIINSSIVNLGDAVNGWIVTDISEQGVTMTYDTQSVVVEPKGVTYGTYEIKTDL